MIQKAWANPHAFFNCHKKPSYELWIMNWKRRASLLKEGTARHIKVTKRVSSFFIFPHLEEDVLNISTEKSPEARVVSNLHTFRTDAASRACGGVLNALQLYNPHNPAWFTIISKIVCNTLFSLSSDCPFYADLNQSVPLNFFVFLPTLLFFCSPHP